jgi:hypothetical protein
MAVRRWGTKLHVRAVAQLRRWSVPSTRTTCAPGLGSPLPHLRRDSADTLPHQHGTGGSPCHTSAPGLGSTLPHLRRDLVHPCHICAGTRLTPCDICGTGAQAFELNIDEDNLLPILTLTVELNDAARRR